MRIGSRSVLVEADGSSARRSRSALRRAGFTVRTCPGRTAGGACPLPAGRRCALVDAADVVVHQLPAEAGAPILDRLRAERGPDVVVPGDGDLAEAVRRAYAGRARRVAFGVRLRDGREVAVGAIRPADAEGLRVFDDALSERSRRLRYLSWMPRLTPERSLELATVDFDRRFAFVARAGDRLVGDCRLVPAGDSRAEIGLVVADDHQGVGLGGALLDLAIEVAAARGIAELTAEVRYDNTRMARLLRSRGFDRTGWELGVMIFTLEPAGGR